MNCKGCHAPCCRGMGGLLKLITMSRSLPPGLAEEYARFPYKVRLDGSCEELVDGRCSVYKTRPLVCDGERVWRKYYSAMTKREFSKINDAACEMLREWRK